MTTTTDPPSTEPAGGTSPRRGSQRVLWAVGLVVILLVALAIKEPELLLPIGPDQGTYSYVAERILDGQLPYVDAWDNKPPATYYLHAAVLALVPEGARWAGTCIEGTTQPCGYVALQIADILWTLATAAAVLALARSLRFGTLAALTSTLLFVVYANVSQLSKEGSTPEKQLLLPMVLAYLCVVRARGRVPLLVLAGALAGCAFLFKQTAISIPIALAAFWLSERPPWFGPRAWLPFALAYLAPLALVALYFGLRGGLDDLWDAAFGYNLVQARTNPLEIPRAALSGAWHVFSDSSALLWLLGLGGALVAVGRRATSSALMLLVWWAIADALSLALGGAKFAQVYFVQLVPSLALLGGLAVDYGWQATRGAPVVRAFAGLCALTLFLLSSQFQATVTLRAWNERTPGHSSTPTEHLLADRFLAGARGGPDEPIFVWGDNSEVYLYAGARASGRFFHLFPLSRQYAERGFQERRQELLRTWETTPPAIIALDPAAARADPDGRLGLNPSSFPELQELLKTRYMPMDASLGGWQAYRRIGIQPR